jgi:hypothetical protein
MIAAWIVFIVVLFFAEQYALKQKRGFVGERLYIVHFGDDGKSSREQCGFVWQSGIKPTGM